MCGWRQPGEDVAFAPEPLFARAAHQRDVQQLDRGASFEAAVAALGQPDAAHPALADPRDQPVGAEGLPRQRERQRRVRRQRHGAFQKARLVHGLVLGEQRPQIGGERRVPRADATPATAARSSVAISSASSRYGLTARQRSGLSGGMRPHAIGPASAIARCR